MVTPLQNPDDHIPEGRTPVANFNPNSNTTNGKKPGLGKGEMANIVKGHLP
jgi:hypothetical protein